ncbi:MAG: hypothetical protein ACFCUU_07700, partial [Cyclobacteriaceae bacterium]
EAENEIVLAFIFLLIKLNHSESDQKGVFKKGKMTSKRPKNTTKRHLKTFMHIVESQRFTSFSDT